MALERISLLRNVGQFDSVATGAQLPLTKLSLIYAENGRGKTTLATIMRSLHSGAPELILERQRLGSVHPPHVVLNIAGVPAVFQNGNWGAPLPRIAVFDDAFVAANVCSGISIETAHRQKLHELILGEQGVALNAALQDHVARIEQHNKDLRTKSDAVPAAARGAMSVDGFCALAPASDIDNRVQEAERNLAAARAADAIRQRASFIPLPAPGFDVSAINALLARQLPDLETSAAARVREHLRSLGRGGEAWVSDGMSRIPGASAIGEHDTCPFCAQDLSESDLIRHYQAYFSEAYDDLKIAIVDMGKGINTTHGGDVPAAFERAVRVAVENREFWSAFTDIPAVEFDTAAIARAWAKAREEVLTVLRAKAASPLDKMELSNSAREAIAAYETLRSQVSSGSLAMLACNPALARVKERALTGNATTLAADLARVNATKARYETATAVLCDRYVAEKAAKVRTEGLRDQARAALDRYRQNIFPAYEAAINVYLRRFNAGYRIGSVASVNNRGGSSANYNVLINDVVVSLTGEGVPNFKNTLSAGDRNTLALAFFFASLEQDPQVRQKIVVIDDPMTSLDEHRSLATIQEIQRLLGTVSQIIVLSHSKPFLCQIWEGADTRTRSAVRIVRDGLGSSFAAWDVRQDCITEHDRRHEQVREYIRVGNPIHERAVAIALRPILEAFMRVAYPAEFPPETALGQFADMCRRRLGQANQVLDAADTAELRALLDYGNSFHHDSNPAYETAAINDLELVDFARRTVAFARKR